MASNGPAGGPVALPGPDRILTWPNLVTTLRLGCIPVFVALLAVAHRRHWFAAAVLLAALGATDWVDGQLARRLHQISTVGKVLDPVADRLLLGVGAIGTLAVGAMPTWVAVVAIAREALVAGAVLALAAAGARRIDVTLVGKAGTFGLMVALPLFLAGHSTVGWHRGAEDLAWVAVVPALVLAWAAAGAYVPRARAALIEGRAGRGVVPAADQGAR